MLREEEETGGGGGTERNTRSRGKGGGRNYITHKYGGPHVGRALRVKTIDFKRLYMNNTVQQNKNFYEEQLLQ